MLIPYDFVSLKQKVSTGDNLEVPRAVATLTRHVDALELKIMELEKKIQALEQKAS